MLALRAILAARADQPCQTLSTLEQALALAEPEGYVRTFIDLLNSTSEGRTMTDILLQTAQRGVAPAYVAHLLQAAGVTISAPSPNTLNEREIQIIALIAAGHSSPKVAETLVISIHTVRTHVKNIYRKLDVHSRVQAVEKAHTLGLV